MHWEQIATVVAIISAPTLALGADESIDDLRKQIHELDQKVRILERKQELEKEQATTKESPRLTVGANGVSFSSADTNFLMKIRGYVQADARTYVGDHIPGNDTFLLRRVRPIIEGTVYEHYDYRIMLDFGSGITSSGGNNGFLQDAYVNVHYWPEFQIQAGKFKPPVGLERLQSGRNMLFIERGYPTQLVPNRDVGIQFHGELFTGTLNYAVGAFNGVQDGSSGDTDVGTDDHKDAAARLFAHPFKNSNVKPLEGFGLGLAGTYGNQAGSLRSFVTPGQQTFFSYRTGSGTSDATANVTADGEHWRLAPQTYYYWGPFGVFGEYVISSEQLRRDAGGATFTTAHNRAWQVAGSYILTGEKNSFAPLVPNRPFKFGEGWGAWELAARYGELRVDDELFPLFATASSARKARSWGAGINWHMNKFVKLSIDYDQTHFDGGSTVPGTVTAQDEKAILSRIQFGF